MVTATRKRQSRAERHGAMTPAQQELAVSHIRMAHKLAHKYASRFTTPAEQDEIESLAMFALCQAAQGYTDRVSQHTGKPVAFSTYLGLHMMHRISNYETKINRVSRGRGRVTALPYDPPVEDDAPQIDVEDEAAPFVESLSQLPSHYRDAIVRRFGFGCDPETYESVGDGDRRRGRWLVVAGLARLKEINVVRLSRTNRGSR